MAKRKRRSQAWKALEREAASLTRGRRVYRGADFSVKDVDVIVDDLPFLQVDAKYRTRHAHHRFMQGIEEKYLKHIDDEPVLFTKTHKQRGCYVTIRGTFFGLLLDVMRGFIKETGIDEGVPAGADSGGSQADKKKREASGHPLPHRGPGRRASKSRSCRTTREGSA